MLLMSGLLLLALGMLLLPSETPTVRGASRDGPIPSPSHHPTPTATPSPPTGGFMTLVPILQGQITAVSAPLPPVKETITVSAPRPVPLGAETGMNKTATLFSVGALLTGAGTHLARRYCS